MSAMPLSDNDLKICFIDGVLFQDWFAVFACYTVN